MTTRMLIDARHPEETRVAVLKSNRIEEFDFESADHKQIKGNIYLAKVTRVEPSLQAAFVDFGGNRHGFLAFSEIHPDYYQIPKEDREALLAEEQAHAEEEARLRAEEEAEEAEAEEGVDAPDDADEDSDALAADFADEDGVEEVEPEDADDIATNDGDESAEGEDTSEDADETEGSETAGTDNRSRRRRGRRQGRGNGSRARSAADEARAKRLALRRRYKIQDVIQRRQVLLVQVVKEERGNKGAALTTYLSLAGRYCVLMPNSSHGGGISRKISSASDRKRLKQIVSEMSLPKTMGCIIRTAGLQRTKPEIKRDFDYLARLWDEIREKTLGSSAPAVIHSDSDLIKRAIRDIYNRDIEEVIVEGAEGYKAAKEFMKLLMPSHARRVKQYADPVPLFQRYGAEDQLTAMYDPVVNLRSGGYLVINPTEALVSIDINSGRSTKEHGIEQTALNTNLEAAREIARQLRLRDMAGLVVIDFIDMEHNSSVRKVEKCMKDALKHDRARIQVGRISGFGLMEMSRQRLRTGVLEATTRACPHCDGTGLVRTASSAGLSALRVIEDEAAKGKGTVITLYASTEAAVYLLNSKRADLAEIEERYGVAVEVLPEGENEGAKMRVTSSGPKPSGTPRFEVILDEDDDEDEIEIEDTEDAVVEDDGGRKRRRRRRGGRRNRNNRNDEAVASDTAIDDDGDRQEEGEVAAAEAADGQDGAKPKKRRRRRRRSNGDMRSEHETAETGEADEIADAGSSAGAPTDAEAGSDEGEAIPATESEPVDTDAAPSEVEKPRRKRSRKKEDPQPEAEMTEEKDEGEPKPKRRRSRAKAKEAVDNGTDVASIGETTVGPAGPVAEIDPVPPTSEGPVEAPAAHDEAIEPSPANDSGDGATEDSDAPRRGWWQRTFGN